MNLISWRGWQEIVRLKKKNEIMMAALQKISRAALQRPWEKAWAWHDADCALEEVRKIDNGSR